MFPYYDSPNLCLAHAVFPSQGALAMGPTAFDVVASDLHNLLFCKFCAPLSFSFGLPVLLCHVLHIMLMGIKKKMHWIAARWVVTTMQYF